MLLGKQGELHSPVISVQLATGTVTPKAHLLEGNKTHVDSKTLSSFAYIQNPLHMGQRCDGRGCWKENPNSCRTTQHLSTNHGELPVVLALKSSPTDLR